MAPSPRWRRDHRARPRWGVRGGRSSAGRPFHLSTSPPPPAKHWTKCCQASLTLPNVEGVVAKRADRAYVAGRGRDWVKVKRQRSVDCVVVGLAGEMATPKLVLALRHADGRLHHFAVTRPLSAEVAEPVAQVVGEASAEQPAIRSRWQHDAVPPWRPVPPRLICEVRVSNLDLSVSRTDQIELRLHRGVSATDVDQTAAA